MSALLSKIASASPTRGGLDSAMFSRFGEHLKLANFPGSVKNQAPNATKVLSKGKAPLPGQGSTTGIGSLMKTTSPANAVSPPSIST